MSLGFAGDRKNLVADRNYKPAIREATVPALPSLVKEKTINNEVVIETKGMKPTSHKKIRIVQDTKQDTTVVVCPEYNCTRFFTSSDDRFLSSIFLPIFNLFLIWSTMQSFVGNWSPHPELVVISQTIIRTFIPLSVAYITGYTLYGMKAAMLSGAVCVGVLASAPVPMILGSFVTTCIFILILKYSDIILKYLFCNYPKLRKIIGTVTDVFLTITSAFLAYTILENVTSPISTGLLDAATHLKDAWLPLIPIILQPTKALFIDQQITASFNGIGCLESAGSYNPTGTCDNSTGSSIMFLIVSNPGPGLGVALAFLFVKNIDLQIAASFATITLLFGGVSQAYVPFVLLYPQLIVPLILGSATGIGTFQGMKSGLTNIPTSPNIMDLLDASPSSDKGGIILGIILSTLVSMVATSLFVNRKRLFKLLSCNGRCAVEIITKE